MAEGYLEEFGHTADIMSFAGGAFEFKQTPGLSISNNNLITDLICYHHCSRRSHLIYLSASGSAPLL